MSLTNPDCSPRKEMGESEAASRRILSSRLPEDQGIPPLERCRTFLHD